MPHTARIVLSNFPYHVMQHAHNRQVVFARDEDYQYYLENLWGWKATLGCRFYGCAERFQMGNGSKFVRPFNGDN